MYTILHIEQSEFFCNIVEDAVRDKGYQYMYTDSFEKAYSILKRFYVDLIITSLSAKDGTIEEFLVKVNKNIKDRGPIFALTGDSLDNRKKRIIDLGVSDYILKSNINEEICSRMEDVLKEKDDMKYFKEVKMAIVEDNFIERDVEERLLNRYGIYNIDYYKSGKDLLKSKIIYDVYLVDIVLKDEFGTNVIRNIREREKDALVIAVTSLNNPKTLASVLNSGADDYIIKPLDENLFMAKLKSNIRNYMYCRKLAL
ncbi:response regulator [Clostridium rectalis]|uniref:response regulator n=1 Tax=Clostridium rectalis TaxID=2040295 RepID=UPI000F62CB86|nr:response regulator [Clostridium rectalis]